MIPRENRPLLRNKIAWVSHLLQCTKEPLNRLFFATTADIFQRTAAPLVGHTFVCVARDPQPMNNRPLELLWSARRFKGVKRKVQAKTMIDYNFIVLARLEHQERIRKIEEELLARQQMERLPSTSDRLLFAVGEWLEHAGARLKAQHQSAIQPTYHSSHAR